MAPVLTPTEPAAVMVSVADRAVVVLLPTTPVVTRPTVTASAEVPLKAPPAAAVPVEARVAVTARVATPRDAYGASRCDGSCYRNGV